MQWLLVTLEILKVEGAYLKVIVDGVEERSVVYGRDVRKTAAMDSE